jgi:hypothetical protein
MVNERFSFDKRMLCTPRSRFSFAVGFRFAVFLTTFKASDGAANVESIVVASGFMV